jgi:hypothetical protein
LETKKKIRNRKTLAELATRTWYFCCNLKPSLPLFFFLL